MICHTHLTNKEFLLLCGMAYVLSGHEEHRSKCILARHKSQLSMDRGKEETKSLASLVELEHKCIINQSYSSAAIAQGSSNSGLWPPWGVGSSFSGLVVNCLD